MADRTKTPVMTAITVSVALQVMYHTALLGSPPVFNRSPYNALCI